MKVLGIIGSPRKNGSTDQLVSAVLSGAAEKGYETKSFLVNDLDIKPCQSCYYCKDNGKCKYEDGYVEIVKALDESDVLVVGSPIYFGEVTAQTKLFIDRLYSLAQNQGVNPKKAVLVYVHADPRENVFKPYLEYQKNTFYAHLGIEIVDTIHAHGIAEPETLKEHDDYLIQAKEAGSKL